MRRTLWVACWLGLVVVACGDGPMGLEEYATEAESLVHEVQAAIDTLDANWESQSPTLEGAVTYWDLRLDARDRFLDGIRGLDPPDQLAEFHAAAVDLFGRLNTAEQALAARVEDLDTVDDTWGFWDSPEGRAAQAVDREVTEICLLAQAEMDATERSDAFADVDWLHTEVSEAVSVAFNCG